MRAIQSASSCYRVKNVTRTLCTAKPNTNPLSARVASTQFKCIPQTTNYSNSTLVHDSNKSAQHAFFSSGTIDSTGHCSKEELRHAGVLNENNLLNFETLHELQEHATKAYSSNELFGTYKLNEEGNGGVFQWMNYREWGNTVEKCRNVLVSLGVKEYSKVGVISNNRWEWATVAAAAYCLNATMVPMYEAQLPKDWTYIINDSECVALFCSTQAIHGTVSKDVLPSTPSVKATLCFDASLGESYSFSSAMDATCKGGDSVKVIKPAPDDLANLVYTSGTTGKPKGVELLHSNTCSNVKGVRSMVADPHDFIRQSDRSLAFLPWAHSYGQTCELWGSVSQGSSIGVCRGVPFILEDLQLVRPTILFAVPTLYKRVYDGVRGLIESSSPLRKKVMIKALELGHRRTEAQRGGLSLSLLERMQLKVLDDAVLSKIRDRFGGELRYGFVAGAACPVDVIEFMEDVGIPVCEGYGLTETSPIITMNVPERRRPGSCGQPLSGVTVVIMGEDGLPAPAGEEGEVCCYGPNVMRGYYKCPEATAEVITLAPDGHSRLFHTGDLGRKDEAGWVQITGRLKDQYKLENGKYVCPGPVEEAICMSRFINQAVLAGANRPYNVALIVPDWAAIRSTLGLDESVSEEDLVNNERVQLFIDHEISSHCAGLKKFETPQDWAIVAPFTAANNMLTPSKGSIRRHAVIRTYDAVVARMYGDQRVSDQVESAEKTQENMETKRVA